MSNDPFKGAAVGSGKGPGKAAAAPAAATKKAAAKAPAAKKEAPKKEAPVKAAAEGDAPKISRAPSKLSKEGTAICEFDGKEYPITAFATVRNKDGEYVRGTVTRKNLQAYRAQKKAEREAAAAAKKAHKEAQAKEREAAAAAKEKAKAEKAAAAS